MSDKNVFYFIGKSAIIHEKNQVPDHIKIVELNGDTANFSSIWTSFEADSNPSINQFAYELALEQLPQGRLKLSYSWLHILTNNLVPYDGITLNLEMSRQSSVVDLEISELLIRISNL